MKQDMKHKPYVSNTDTPSELTGVSIINGILLAIVFGAANAYLGLRVGMTVSASIPAAVISMGVLRVLLKRNSILENNMVQTIGSAGESLAAGAIFTLPALFMWANETGETEPVLLEIACIALAGGLLGVLFMIPLRQALIVKEHGILPYPEGKACADVLIAGEEGGTKASTVFKGFGIAFVYKFLADGMKLFPSQVDVSFKKYHGGGVGADVLPALLGVGYICGPKVSSYLLSGGIVAWLVLMPLFCLLGNATVLYPAEISVIQVYQLEGTWGIWSHYIRYIGAGAVATGGIISLLKNLPLIVKTFVHAIKGYGREHENNQERIARDIPMPIVGGAILVITLLIWLFPSIPVNFPGALMIAVFGFFFATVSSRMVGLVGSSNNPISGMSIATLLLATAIFKMTGATGISGMIAAIAVGSVICIITAIAGDSSQDLKTGYLLGATPKKQQIGELIGVFVSSMAIGGILFLLNKAWGFGSTQLPAPQATLMKMVVEGVMEGNLPWNLVAFGVFLAIAMEILRVPVLPFAVGLYLPIHLSVPMMIGGLVRGWFEQKESRAAFGKQSQAIEQGILYSSGLIAGEGMMGITLAVLALISVKDGSTLGDLIDVSHVVTLGNAGGMLAFLLLTGTLILAILKPSKQEERGGI